MEAVQEYAGQMPDIGPTFQSMNVAFGAAGLAVEAGDWIAAERGIASALSELRILLAQVDRVPPPREMSGVHKGLRRALALHNEAFSRMLRAIAAHSTIEYLEAMKTYLDGSKELARANQHLTEYHAQHSA